MDAPTRPDSNLPADFDFACDSRVLALYRAAVVLHQIGSEVAAQLRWTIRLVPLAAGSGAAAAGLLVFCIVGHVPAGLTEVPPGRLALDVFDACAPTLAGLVVLSGLVGPLAVRWRDFAASGVERGLIGVGLSPDSLLRAPSWLAAAVGFAVLGAVFHAAGHALGPGLASLASGGDAFLSALPARPDRPALLCAAGGLLTALWVTWGANRKDPTRPIESLDRAAGLWIASQAALAVAIGS